MTNDLTQQIATELRETDAGPRSLIRLIIKALGEEETQQLFQQTLEIESSGGMLTNNKKKRRTPGGVFFYLAHGAVAAKGLSWYALSRKGEVRAPQASPEPNTQKTKQSSKTANFQWSDRLELLADLEHERGEASTVKVTLIGRPGKIIEKGNVIITAMQSKKAPAMSKQLPKVPEKPTNYVLLIAKKQWNKVAEAIKDPEDVLIVEGYPQIDAKMQAITVFVQSTTTKMLQRAKKEAQASDG